MMTPAYQERLYLEYRGKVLGYIRSKVSSREDAEDLCSDVFEKVFRSIESFDGERATLATWIYRIARNAVIDYYRRQRPTEELPETLACEDRLDEGILREEGLDELAQALERLTPELSALIVLRYFDGLTLTEIAQRMDLSYGAVKLRHQKALTFLKATLERLET